MVDLSVAAVTVIGQKHRQRGVPCEDASVAVTSNGVSAVVVADGAGSKQYTHARFGSAAAVNTIAKLLTEHFDALYNENKWKLVFDREKYDVVRRASNARDILQKWTRGFKGLPRVFKK